MTNRRLFLVSASSLAAANLLTGCFPVVATGMVVGAMSISERRTTGAQVDDQGIELKAFNRLRERFKNDEAVKPSITSFNRTVLITGFAPDQSTKTEIGQMVGKVENVRAVINELYVGPPSSLLNYGADVVLTTRVKAAMLDKPDLNANLIKVVTETGTVYLMGLVTQREATRASEIASRVPGARRVIQAFEVITDDQARAIDTALQGNKPAPEAQGGQSQDPGAAKVTPVR